MITKKRLAQSLSEVLAEFPKTREILTYLNRFGTAEGHRFAIIKISGGVLDGSLNDLIPSLSFMTTVGLIPILIHGAGPQLDAILQKAGIESRKIDGMRVTPPEAVGLIRKVMNQESHRFQDRLEAAGVRVRPFSHGVLECAFLDKNRYGFVGKVKKVHTDGIKNAIQRGFLPLVSPLGETPSGQILNINADTATRALARKIKPNKIVFLTPTGGILGGDKEIIPAINLETDFARINDQPWLEGGMRLKLSEIKELLDELPSSSSVSITSAKQLSKELFTHKGAGTLVRKGERIFVQTRFLKDEIAEANALLEKCFNRRIDPKYLSKLPLQNVIWAESRRALAVIAEGVDSFPYLDKFAVTPEAQGEGLGAAIWTGIKDLYPNLYWRSRSNNPINLWYLKQADTMIRSNEWLIFSYGISARATLERCKKDTESRTVSWID